METRERVRGTHRMPAASGYRIGLVDKLPEIGKLRPVWEDLQFHPNADIDLFIKRLELKQASCRPCIFTLERNETPAALAIGRIEKTGFDIRLGYKSLFKPEVRMLIMNYGGFLGEYSEEMSGLLMGELVHVLKRGQADLVFINSVSTDCSLLLQARAQRLFLADLPGTHWSMRLPGSVDLLLGKLKSKHRYWIRRLPRVLERDYPGRIAFKTFVSVQDIDQLFRDAEAVAGLTYQRGLGAGFSDNREIRERIELAASKGWLRAFLLYVEEEPWAFWIGTLYKNTFHLDFTGYDPRFQKYEPGTILFVKMLESISAENVETVDFGFGPAFYKQRFGDKQWEETSCYVFAPSVKGKFLFCLYSSVKSVERLLRLLLAKSNFLDRLKKLWRRKLGGESQDTPSVNH